MPRSSLRSISSDQDPSLLTRSRRKKKKEKKKQSAEFPLVVNPTERNRASNTFIGQFIRLSRKFKTTCHRALVRLNCFPVSQNLEVLRDSPRRHNNDNYRYISWSSLPTNSSRLIRRRDSGNEFYTRDGYAKIFRRNFPVSRSATIFLSLSPSFPLLLFAHRAKFVYKYPGGGKEKGGVRSGQPRGTQFSRWKVFSGIGAINETRWRVAGKARLAAELKLKFPAISRDFLLVSSSTSSP